MSPPAQSRLRRRARLTFRWFRITVWLLVLAVICVLLWLNRVGLPDFLKQRLLAELRSQGMELEFSRLRLHWYHGIVAENVRFEQANHRSGPRLSGQELMLRLDHAALWRRQLKLRGVTLNSGRLTVPLVSSNAPVREVAVERIQSQIDFLSDNHWQLSSLDGHSFGIDFHLSGIVTNASALLAWKAPDDAAARQRAEFWNRVVARLEEIQISPAARMKGTFSSDAQAPEASSARVELEAARFKSPWGAGRDLALSLAVSPKSNTLAQAELKLSARATQSPWGQAVTLKLSARADVPFAAPQPREVRLSLEAEVAQTPWAARKRSGSPPKPRRRSRRAGPETRWWT